MIDVGDQLGRALRKLFAVTPNPLLMSRHAYQHVRETWMRSSSLPNSAIFVLGNDWLHSPYGGTKDWPRQDTGGFRPILTLLVPPERVPLPDRVEGAVIARNLRLEVRVAQQPQIAGADQLVISAARGTGYVNETPVVNCSGHSAARYFGWSLAVQPVKRQLRCIVISIGKLFRVPKALQVSPQID